MQNKDKQITADMLDTVKVQFLKPIFEDDFVERGMKAWLTSVEWCVREKCYELTFDFSEFEEGNIKYFKESYYENICTRKLNLDKEFYTAIEAGCYTSKYSVYFSVKGDSQDDVEFNKSIIEYLKVID